MRQEETETNRTKKTKTSVTDTEVSHKLDDSVLEDFIPLVYCHYYVSIVFV